MIARIGRALAERPWLRAALILGLLTVLWAPDAVIGRSAFWSHDLRHHHLPWRVWAAAEWGAGRVPLWSPEVGAGFPLMADGQTGVFYLPTMLLFALLPAPLALSWSLLGHLWWAGLGAWALLRALQHSERASLLGAVGFGFGGFLVSHSHYLGFQNGAAWLPWLLFAIATRRDALGGLAALAMLVAGHPQMAAIGLLVAAVFALSQRRALPSAAALSLAGVAAAPQLLATLELARFGLREGGLPPAMASVGSLPPQELINGLIPTFFGFERPADIAETYLHRGAGYWGTGENYWEMAFYLGAPVVVLALLGMRRRGGWALGALLCLGLMLGGHTPLWPALRHLPGLDGFRFPARFALGLSLAACVLAATGLDALRGLGAAGLRRAGWGAMGAAALLLLASLVGSAALKQGEDGLRDRLTAWASARPPAPPVQLDALARASLPPEEPRDAAAVAARVEAVLGGLEVALEPGVGALGRPAGLLALIGLGLLLRARGRLGEAPLAVGLVALLYADLYSFGADFQARTPWDEVVAEPPALAHLDGDLRAFRLSALDRRQDPALDLDLLSANLGLLWGTRDVLVPSPLRIVREEALLSLVGLDVGDKGPEKVARLLAHRPLLDLLGVRWLLTVHAVEGPGLALRWQDRVRLYENATALPPAFLVGCAIAPPAGASPVDWAWSAMEALDPRRQALLEAPVNQISECEDGSGVGEARLALDAPQRMVVAVDARRPALLLMNQTWYPGWQATVNGAPAELLRADFAFRGVVVPVGASEVALVYRPGWLRAALAIAPLALLALITWAVVSARRGRGAAKAALS